MSLNQIKRLYQRNNNVKIKKNATAGLNVNSNLQLQQSSSVSQCPQAGHAYTRKLLF